ncbi:FH protein interacting protein FIP2 isoform X1 [Cucumis melo]|uniref:FH protein interacting protein FIP2 isoform X1 n=2 Tax=Cucumis melo TaxID=3656 RepID=A0ABM3L281_CUCME|nr:FH protein interacting protein FIP2 isoform X1 [Cucumis melo]
MKGVSDPSLIRLNIGGKKFRTTLDTLTLREPDSMLAAMFSGRHTLCQDPEEGSIFLDRDGKHFRHILNWLRDGIVPFLSDFDLLELLREAEYYQLLGLMDRIRDLLSNRKEDEEPQSELKRVDIIKCIQSEKVRLRGVNLCGLDLSKLDLSYVDFSYASLKNVFFSRANLQCAKFRDADAEGSIFHNATLREYKINILFSSHHIFFLTFLRIVLIIVFCLERCEFTGANLRGALLAAANLQSANLQDACLVDCSFCGADLRSAHLQGADLTNANLEGANLEGANLKGAKLLNANLRSANLQRAYLRYVNLRDTQLEGARLDGANLLGAIR